MVQADDHQAAGDCPAGLSGPRHARAECPGDSESCLAVQTGPPSVYRQDGLGSGEAVEKDGKDLVGILEFL
jgi:hypothetical protein